MPSGPTTWTPASSAAAATAGPPASEPPRRVVACDSGYVIHLGQMWTTDYAGAVIGEAVVMPWLTPQQFVTGVAPASSRSVATRRPVAYSPAIAAKLRMLCESVADSTPDDRRALANAKWLVTVEIKLHESRVGRCLPQLHDDPEVEVKKSDLMQDVFAAKESNTLVAMCDYVSDVFRLASSARPQRDRSLAFGRRVSEGLLLPSSLDQGSCYPRCHVLASLDLLRVGSWFLGPHRRFSLYLV